MAKILIVLTSHTQLGNTGKRTGYYFDEMAAPYWTFSDAGHSVDIATISGGPALHDPGCLNADPEKRPSAVTRFINDMLAMASLSHTPAIADVDLRNYSAIFLAGGHGTMWDFAESEGLASAVSNIFEAGGVVGAVCHGPAGLVNAKRADGKPLVQGLRVNAFTNSEENSVGLQDVVPFHLESKLRELGGKFEGATNFANFAIRDGRLITGQNPQSAVSAAKLVIDALADKQAKAA